MPSTRMTWWCNAFDPIVGGAELWARQVVRHFRDAGHEQRVIAITDGAGPSRAELWEGVPLIVFHGSELLGGGPALPLAITSIGKTLADQRPEVVLVSNFGHASLALLGLARSKITAPTVLIAHNTWMEEASVPGSPLDVTARRAAGIIAFDEHVADWLRSRWPSATITSVPFAMPPLDTPVLPLPNVPQLLFCGRLSEEKGPLVLVEAMAALIKSHPAAQLVMAGSGHQRAEIQLRIDALGLGGHVRLIGGIPPGEVGTLIDQSSLLCLPSISEGVPLSALEAAWRARPIVASHVGGLPRIVADGETGLLVPPGDPQALADALAELLNNPKRAQAMGDNARARAEARPSWGRHLAELEAGIEAAIGAGDRDARSALG